MYGTGGESQTFFSFAEGNNDYHDCGLSARPGSNGGSIFFFLKVYKILVGFTMDIKEARRARDYIKT